MKKRNNKNASRNFTFRDDASDMLEDTDNSDDNQNVETDVKKKKKNRTITIILDIVIIVLLAVAAFLILNPIFEQRQRDEAMRNLASVIDNQFSGEQSTVVDDETSNTTMPSSLEDSFLIDGKGIWVDANKGAIDGEAYEDFGQDMEEIESTAPYFYLEPLGSLQIGEIDLNLPLFKGASYVPLRYGAGWYQSSAEIGGPGRTTILGHTMLSATNSYFSRLTELELGDEIRIINEGKIYTYNVHDIKVVEQKELIEYLVNNDVDSEVMLVTCTPRPRFHQRLLVFAELSDISNQ